MVKDGLFEATLRTTAALVIEFVNLGIVFPSTDWWCVGIGAWNNGAGGGAQAQVVLGNRLGALETALGVALALADLNVLTTALTEFLDSVNTVLDGTGWAGFAVTGLASVSELNALVVTDVIWLSPCRPVEPVLLVSVAPVLHTVMLLGGITGQVRVDLPAPLTTQWPFTFKWTITDADLIDQWVGRAVAWDHDA